MRTRIMLEAWAEMNEHGVRFTMSNLAARLAISKRTLYEHFESKEVLVESIVDAVIADIQVQRMAIVNNPDLDIKEKLIRMLSVRSSISASGNDRVKLELAKEYSGVCKKAHKFEDEQWEIIEAIIKEGIQAGCFRPIFVPVLRKIVRGAVQGIADYDFLLLQRTSISEMIGHVTDILLYGIVAPGKCD